MEGWRSVGCLLTVCALCQSVLGGDTQVCFAGTYERIRRRLLFMPDDRRSGVPG